MCPPPSVGGYDSFLAGNVKLFPARPCFAVVCRAMIGETVDVEIVFTVTQETDGGFVAECLTHDIFTHGNSWEELRANVREAVAGYFFDQPKLSLIRLHLVRDEVMPVA